MSSSAYCCVPGCSTAAGGDWRLYHFPNPEKDSERFRTWMMRIGGDIVQLANSFIYSNRRVCGRHFESKWILARNLSQLAVPSLNLPGHYRSYPNEFQNQEDSHIESLDGLQSVITESAASVQISAGCSTICLDVVMSPEPSTSHCTEPSTSCELVQNIIASEGSTGEHVVMNPGTSTKVPRKSSKLTQNKPKGLKQYKTVSKEEVQLLKEVLKVKTALTRTQNKKVELMKQLRQAKKLTKGEAFKNLTEHLDPAAKTFFAMQIHQCSKKPKGRRFTIEEKILALTLYKPSPKAYQILKKICALPSRRTLDKLLHKVTLKAGVNDILFENLKAKVNSMQENHKYCAILFDEMAISPHLTYNVTEDAISGFCQDGATKTLKFCDHVLVFMIRGVFKKYKQAIAYSFCSGTTSTVSLTAQLKQIISKVQETGLKVISTVCDQGTTNIASINYLIKQTRETYIKDNKEWKEDFFEINEEKIYAIYDPPHLIKGIRNNFMTKDLEFMEKNTKKVAKWSHLTLLHKKAPHYRGVKLLPKLTDRHIIPNMIPKMRVKNATQVFSHTVAAALGFMAGVGKLPKETKDTADVLLLFNDLFDSVNGNFHQPVNGNHLRAAVTPKSPHHLLWRKSIPILKTMKFINKTGRKGSVPSIESWVKTIKAFQNIVSSLRSVGITSLLLRNFNQDPLENYFGSIRAHGCANRMPSANDFANSFKILLFNNMASSHSVGANCEKDDAIGLNAIKTFLNQNNRNQDHKKIEITVLEEEHLFMDPINTMELINSSAPADKEKCAAAAYCSGWILSLSKKIFRQCSICTNDLECSQEEEYHKFISYKKFTESSWLHYPTRALVDFFLQVEHIVYTVLENNAHKNNILIYIETVVFALQDINFLKCDIHKKELVNFLLKKSILFFIKLYCKEVNSILSGKDILYSGDDKLKLCALNYYKKHSKNKRK